MVENDIVDFVPVVRSGRRAPHVWVDEQQRHSLLDEFGWEYLVVRGGPAAPELGAQVEHLADSGFPIRRIDLPTDAGADLYATDETVVVRPDGVVAARTSDGLIDLAELCLADG